jgi:hypothetical protein
LPGQGLSWQNRPLHYAVVGENVGGDPFFSLTHILGPTPLSRLDPVLGFVRSRQTFARRSH